MDKRMSKETEWLVKSVHEDTRAEWKKQRDRWIWKNKVIEVARKFVNCKGRYHSEQNMTALIELFRQEANSPVIPDGWTNNGMADSALVMLDRIDTLDPDDDVRIEEVKRIVRQLASALQQQNEPQNIPNIIPDSCKLTYDEQDYKWDSACGESWQFTDGGPEDNHVRFCQGCGKSVVLQPATEG